MNEPRKRLILIVDDVADNREVYNQFLVHKGFQVALAGDGREALEKARQLRPDLIVMDLSLPIMDGWEATRRLKKNKWTKHIPILALSAHAQDDVSHTASQAGADKFITKPFAPEALVKEITRMLD